MILAQSRAIESNADNVDDLNAGLVIDEELERYGVTVVQRLRRSGFGKCRERTIWSQRGVVFQKRSSKCFVGRQNGEAKLFRVRISVHPKVVTEDDVLLCVRQHAVNDSILAGKSLRVEQRLERLAFRNTLAARCFASKSNEAAVRNLEHELALRGILCECTECQAVNRKEKNPELTSHSGHLL